jgi:ABC-type phosphate/phosphonate transport system substrate-binding protein
MVRAGVDIDWQGTFSDAFVANYNHDYRPDGETISPQIVLRLNAAGIPDLVHVFDPGELVVEPQPLSMVLPYHDFGAGPLAYAAAAHKLGSLLQDELGLGLDVFVPPGDPAGSLEATIAAVMAEQADLTMLNWLPYLWLHETAGAEVAVGHLRLGDLHYYSQFYTRFDSGITDLTQLAGEHLCWADPTSTSGYVIPMLRLQALGIDGDADSEFTGSHTQVARALYDGASCAAGAAFWDVRPLVAEADDLPDINDIVQVLGPQSTGIPNESFVFGASFPEELREPTVAALLAIAGPYSEPDPSPPGFAVTDVLFPGYEGLVAVDHSAYLGLLGLINDAGMTVEEVVEQYLR